MSTTARRRSTRPRARDRASRWRLHPALPSLLALVLCVVALGAAVEGVFTVKTVRLVGEGLPSSRILSAAAVSGSNIFLVRSDDVITRLSSVREIVVSAVDTQFPDRVVIHAQLRPSLVAWRTPSGLYILDTDGRVIDRVTRTSLPIIVGSDRGGRFGAGVVQAVRYAVQALRTAPKGGIAVLNYDGRSGLTITGRAGWHAIVGTGSPASLVRRIAELVAVLRAVSRNSESLVTLDLRYPKPVARFVSP